MTSYLPTEVFTTPLAHYAREKELVGAGWERGRGARIPQGHVVPFYRERSHALNPPGLIGPCWDVIHLEWHHA